jgi:pimeloyl-ACP methyl ester carboxylesterase
MPTLNLNEISLYYAVYGKGTPIVFIHPPLMNSTNFHYQIKELSEFFQVIVFDIRGHGNSSPSEEPITYSLIVEDIRQLLDHLYIDKAYLCGYSTGGSIVLEFLLSHPDRGLGGMVISGMSEVSDVNLRNKIRLGVQLSRMRAVKTLAFSVSLGNADSKETFRRLYRDALKVNSKNVMQYYDYSIQYNCTEQLWSVTCPILLVFGKKDKPFHRYASLLKKHLPYPELVYLNDAPHQIPTKAHIEMNDLIKRFIYTHKRPEKHQFTSMPLETPVESIEDFL